MGTILAMAGVLLGADTDTQPSVSAVVVPSDRATVLGRTIEQLGGRWTMRWRVRWHGPGNWVLDPTRVGLAYRARVSNPACPGHGLPRSSTAHLDLGTPSGREATAEVIPSKNPNHRCSERLVLSVAVEGGASVRAGKPRVRVGVGGVVTVRLDIHHDPPVYGRWVALLGERTIEVSLGEVTLGDRVVLHRVLNRRIPPSVWDPPKARWRDTTMFHSPPDSWAMFPGKDARNTLTINDIPVRFGTRYELVFWARVDADAPDRFRASVQPMQAAPRHYKHLGAPHVRVLPSDDRWHRHRLVWTNSPSTNRVMIQFKFVGAKMGGAWIDDMELRALPTPRRAP